jgi:hypothetical protein
VRVDRGALYLDELVRQVQIVELDTPLLFDVVDTSLFDGELDMVRPYVLLYEARRERQRPRQRRKTAAHRRKGSENTSGYGKAQQVERERRDLLHRRFGDDERAAPDQHECEHRGKSPGAPRNHRVKVAQGSNARFQLQRRAANT